MSSRMLRKLHGPDRIEAGEADEDNSELDLGRGARPKRPGFNPFDSLQLRDDSCSESEVKEDDDLGADSSRMDVLQRQDTKKKRKKKRKKGAKSQVFSSEDNKEAGEDDEVERCLKEVNDLVGQDGQVQSQDRRGSKGGGKNPASTLRSLLSIDYKNLNPDNEMKKIFGTRVVQAEQRQRHHHHRPGGRNRAPIRSSHSIIVPKANWPNAGKAGGLSMRFIDSDSEGNQYFAFEHSLQYQGVQKDFYLAVESMNPDFIVQLLNQHPFHIDAMLQLSDICKMGEDVQMATELIERALFTMEAAFHPLFNLAVGTCRLDYKIQENRSFFIALFRHMNFVSSRACYKTALEFAKLILSLDQDDPLGILLLLDFLATRSQQYKWFISVYEELEPKKNLSQLPNWAFGVAVARFYAAEESDKDFAKADASLQEALIMFPGVLHSLLDKCSIEGDKAAMHPYFMEAHLKQTRGLDILTKLYVGRSYHVWKQPELLPWLERNATAVTSRVDAGGDAFIRSCAEKRGSRYQGAPRNVYRHVIMSDISDATASLPKELADAPVMSYDPLPPVDSINKYTNQTRLTQMDDPSTLRLFFRSLLPNFNPSDPLPEGQDNGEAQGGGADLRSSVNSLYEAMQDLLSNLHLPEVRHEGADSEDSDDEQDWR